MRPVGACLQAPLKRPHWEILRCRWWRWTPWPHSARHVRLSKLAFLLAFSNQRIRLTGKKPTNVSARFQPSPQISPGGRSAKKSFGESAINRNDVTRDATRLRAGEKQNRTR